MWRTVFMIMSSQEKHRTYDDELLDLFRARNIAAFMELAVAAGKTIVFAGATGSGKTTYMKSLIDFIPLNTRLITIEDAEEIKFFIHKNYVHLLPFGIRQ